MAANSDRTPPLLYIECDVPDGVTLMEWRRVRSGRRAHGSPFAATVRRLYALGRPPRAGA
jgi:hypothetical protein